MKRGSGLSPEGPQVFGPPDQFPGRRGQRGRGARAERGAEPRVGARRARGVLWRRVRGAHQAGAGDVLVLVPLFCL